MQLSRAVRNRTTGVLYVLDEPSIGLHPLNIAGLKNVMDDLVADGNSVVLVDHDTQILSYSDWIIEMGPSAGIDGGQVIAKGSVDDIKSNLESKIGPFLSGESSVAVKREIDDKHVFSNGAIYLETSSIHTVKPLTVKIPKGKLTVVTGVSGSGKTTLILESLIPALEAFIKHTTFPSHIKDIKADGINQIKLIDATPIGINVRSTVATYADIHDELRKLFAKSADAKRLGYKAGDFSYNTGNLRCINCDGTGTIALDVQFLPDVNIEYPTCRGTRYAKEISFVKIKNSKDKEFSLADLMAMDVAHAYEYCKEYKIIAQRLKVLMDLGLGYLTLGEETPSLSGGEAQRLKLASEMGKGQSDSVFVFDEPTIGLHPLDIKVLMQVFNSLIKKGATVIVIEHDLDVIRSADYIIDMGPGGGTEGGRIVACGTPYKVKHNPCSITGRFI